MNNQVTLFDSNFETSMEASSAEVEQKKVRPSELEQAVYANIYTQILTVCNELNLSPEDFSLIAGTGYSSVKFASLLVMRLKFRGNNHYVSFPKAYAVGLSNNVNLSEVSTEPGYARIYTSADNISDIASEVRSVIRTAIQRIPKEYDCCSLYLECSNAKKCIKPDKRAALACGYKKILESGTIYYGKNRTIDRPNSLGHNPNE